MPPLHGSPGRPIALLDDDDEENAPQQLSDLRNNVRRAMERARIAHPIYDIDEDDPDEYSYENEFQEDEFDISRVQEQNQRPRSQARPQRNSRLHSTHRSVSTVAAYGFQLKTSHFLELHEPLGICLMWSGQDDNTRSPVGAQFVEIKSIWVSKHNDQDIIIRGLPYARTRQLHGRLENKRNEVCQIIEIDEDDKRPDEDQALVEIRPEQIKKTRALIKTNKLFPRDGKPRFDAAYNTPQKIEEFAPLTCRWKMRTEYRDAAKRKAGRSFGGSLTRLAEDEIEKRRDKIPDKELRESWRGPNRSTPGHSTYTFGDMFCGAGGVSRGAAMAGLDLKVAVDQCHVACKSYRRNFSNVQLHEQDITSFINDESRHAQYFNTLINAFTVHGYSIQWRLVSFPEYSSPSKRNRLVIFGACPGEKLPPWLPPPHGARTHGKKPLVTERQAIDRLRPNTDLHDIRHARPANKPPRDGNAPLPETIVCGGTNTHQHYSGTRWYTLRELACLQGFPVVHRFEGTTTEIRKQIGNAFPPCVAKVFLEPLIRHLERTDGVQPAPRPGPSSSRRRMNREVQRDVRPQLDRYNGDFDEDEALEFALQQSKDAMNIAGRPAAPPAPRRRLQPIVVDLRDSSDEDDGGQDSPVSRHFAPLVERMSIASPRDSPHPRNSPVAQASQNFEDSGSRSRSATLDFSPSPSRKRSLEDMHDGIADETMQKESPEKRERLVGSVEENDGYVVANTIPSRLPRYGGPHESINADRDEYVVLGEPSASAAAAPRRADNPNSYSDELVLGVRSSYKEAAGKKQRSSVASGDDDDGWTF
ncbi:hypothetical protein VMCG_07030 [Cytospora schulzeri]|uniref:DNA (cytosine-5-)-methyltransferase n=1 Tax=Cytospora schulzeri TaxID=448051 RepID=A0A423W408_9PEZI|nr:hypothetical protein VMCG_07030 [Valsa malicola]